MRKQQELTIAGRRITVKEIRVRDLLKIMENDNSELAVFVEYGLEGLAEEELFDLYPSEIREIWEAFRAVNADFFEAARRIGAGDLLEKGFLGSIWLKLRSSAPENTETA